MFLAKAGGQDVEVPKPITRREKLLQAIIDNGSGGSGDTGGGTETLDALIDGSITEIVSNAETVSERVFYYNTKVKKITLPHATYVENRAFSYASVLTNVDFGSNDVTLLDSAFEHCAALVKATGRFTSSKGSVFANCYKLEEVCWNMVGAAPSILSSTHYINFSLKAVRIIN